MKNRFGGKQRHSGGGLREVLFPVLFFVALIALFAFGLQSISKTTQAEQLRSTEQAIRRASVHCYAVEGEYPQSLDYLESHYGLSIDHKRYLVHYEPVAANLMPQISVFPLESGQ